MLKILFRFIWSNICFGLFWLLGIVRLPCKSEFKGPRSSRKVTLTSLPNELLFNIFDRVPVKDLICRLPRICSQFYKISKLTCNRRRVLNVICCNSKCLITAKQNSTICDTLKIGKISQLNVQNCQKIISIFPNILSLQLIASGVTVSQLNESITDILLSCLYDQLEVLHLELTFEFHVFFRQNDERLRNMRNDKIERKRALERAFKLINRMSRLRRLALYSSSELPPLKLTIICQLREFDLFSHCAISNVNFELLLKYGGSSASQLKRIGIGCYFVVEHIRMRGIHETRVLLSKITHFDAHCIDFENIDHFRNLLLCMGNMCEFSICLPVRRPLVELIRALVPLTSKSSKLAKLNLTILSGVGAMLDGLDEERPLDMFRFVAFRPSIKLHSIKNLKFIFNTPSHENYQQLHLDLLFPNLRKIHFHIISSCSTMLYVDLNMPILSPIMAGTDI